ncbi:MAG TPA: YvcK family protein [Pyrinomonadaceae bacterium]|nr:YvcK family protein [Pyrinomonadaceae bacterium]
MEKGSNIDSAKRLNVVAIGGGNGLSTLLSGLKRFVGQPNDEVFSVSRLSAIVAVTDDGGSSGRLRDELQMLPPGDIRNCMVALSEDSLLLSRLFRHRFTGSGDLGGHSFGNIFLAALTDLTGDFAEAVRLSSEILASKGHIYPATTANVHLVAELTDGSIIKGETNISNAGPSIQRLYLDPETCHPMPEAISAIESADLITIGPGSLFTSLLPPLLVHGVADAVANSLATRVFVSNLMTQPGETDRFSAERHAEVLNRYAPQIKFDYVLLNSEPTNPEQRRRYAEEGAEQIGIGEVRSIENACGARVVYTNLLRDGEMVRHDPDKLADAVLSCSAVAEAVG